ncbi:transcription factor IBH1-like [Mercurialis annua]|uniref:transcription factor IBH1-like n=1 Tax=Mercurialis annua TaxID=3986 RepID=UPI00215E356C|nr:transcription factor IBH1-like [Mercurialis annua]
MGMSSGRTDSGKMKLRRKIRTRRKRGVCGGGRVEMKVKKLQRIIPGGEGLQPERLFLRTADYIMQLRSQVNILQALSDIYNNTPEA